MYHCLHCGKENKWVRQNSNKYCDNKCQGAATREVRIKEYLEGKHWVGKNIPHWIKGVDGLLARDRGYACECCGISKWQDAKIVLECDHIDGNKTNNVITNLRLLCPNCHSQTDTFKGRNKKAGLAEMV